LRLIILVTSDKSSLLRVKWLLLLLLVALKWLRLKASVWRLLVGSLEACLLGPKLSILRLDVPSLLRRNSTGTVLIPVLLLRLLLLSVPTVIVHLCWS
jgi:hypothetical protein